MSTAIAVDLAKSVFFEVAVSDTPGQVRIRRRLRRAQFARFVATQPPATVLLEACGSTHYWSRHAKKTPVPTHLQAWALAVEQHRGHNKAAVALANKLARIVWAVWRSGQPFAA